MQKVHTDTTSMITGTDISFAYATAPVLRDCGISLAAGTFTALLGPNGAGKSTLLKILTGLLTPHRGTVALDGQPLASYPRRTLATHIAYVPQDTGMTNTLCARDLVALGRLPHQRGLGWLTHEDREAIDAAMARMDCAHLAARCTGELSGGERQRVLIARALAQQARVLLLDEPIAHLDCTSQAALMHTLQALQQQGLTICCALHDINLAMRHCTQLVLLQQGTIRASGAPADVATPATLTAMFGAPMQWQHTLGPA